MFQRLHPSGVTRLLVSCFDMFRSKENCDNIKIIISHLSLLCLQRAIYQIDLFTIEACHVLKDTYLKEDFYNF